MTETSRSLAPWVYGLVALIVLLGCCLSGVGGIFLHQYRKEARQRTEDFARLDELMRRDAEGATDPRPMLPPGVKPPSCEVLIPDESFEDFQRRCPGRDPPPGHAPGTVGACEEPLAGESIEAFQRRCFGGYGGRPRVAIVAVVESALGASVPVRVGQQCGLVVENPERGDGTGARWCRTEVRCGDAIVYGGGTSGFFPCTFSTQPPAVIGSDEQTSSGDQDGAFEVDTRLGRLSVSDDASGRLGTFMIAARITSVR